MIHVVTVQNTLADTKTATTSSTKSNARTDVLQKSPLTNRRSPIMRSQSDKVVSSKPVQESGPGYDAKLVEMINTVIVDRSPSVKWDDVGEKLYHIFFLLFFFVFYFYVPFYFQFYGLELQTYSSNFVFSFWAAGLEKAKQALLEMVILPTKRKDLFTGLRRPARGDVLEGYCLH